MLEGESIYVLDIEVKRSPDACITCDQLPKDCQAIGHRFEKIGWERKAALGISIGCAFSYKTMQFVFFDEFTLESLMTRWVEEQPLLVGFNSQSFDLTLMRGLLRQEADALHLSESAADLFRSGVLVELCDRFKDLCAISYDILAEIWRVDPGRKFEPGLNSLDTIAQANRLPAKAMTGAIAPRLWAAGRYAEVINYCAADVEKTRRLFEMICWGTPLLRGDRNPIVLPPPPGLEH